MMRQLLFWTSTVALGPACTCSQTTEIQQAAEQARLERLPRSQNGLLDAAVAPAHRTSHARVAAPSEPTPKRCQSGSAQQTITALGTAVGDEDFAPFGVEVGVPLVEKTGFWIPWLSTDGKASSVGINEVHRDLLSSRTVSLGAVHWDGGPPRVARVNAETLLTVVPDGDAHGGNYRIAAISGSSLTWGADVDGSSDDSPAFDLAATGGKALLVWDDYDRSGGRGTVRGVLLGPDGQISRDLDHLSSDTADVEGPRLTKHEHGYWLAWLRVVWTPKTKGPVAAPTTVAPDSEGAAVQVKERWIEVLPLDLDGNPSAEPLRVSAADAMVQGFDLEAGHGGGLVISWRQDFANAGTNGGEIWTAHLDAGGALEAFAVEAPAVGGTLPVLLFDPQPPSGVPHGWLSVEASGGDSALAALSPFGKPLEVLTGNVGLGVASVIAALDGQLLLAKPQGRNIVLQLARCAYSPGAAGRDAGVPH